mgnify:CR=1 FL=1
MEKAARGIGSVATALLVLVLAACGGSSGASTPSSTAVDPLTETVPASTVPADLPVEPGVLRVAGERSLGMDLVQTAVLQGFFAKEGLDAQVAPAAGEAAVRAALHEGRADAAVVGSAAALRLAARDPGLRIVLILGSATTGEVILGGPEAPDVASLAGRRVAYEPGGDAELLLRSALANVAVPFAAITPVDPGARGAGAKLLDGAAAAAVVGAVQAAEVQAADGTAQPIAAAGDQPGLVSQMLVVPGRVLRERPGQVLAFVRGWEDLYLYERDNADEVAASIAASHGRDAAAVAAELAGVDLLDVPANAVDLLPGGEFYDRTIGVIAEQSAAAGWIAAVPAPQQVLDGSFAQAVASAR